MKVLSNIQFQRKDPVMRSMRMITAIIVLICMGMSMSTLSAEPGRLEVELTGADWKLWLDRDAQWQNDEMYPPPVDLSMIPVNPPSCGWDEYEKKVDKIVEVPATVEEHFWSDNGNPIGIAGDYRGVSWWGRTFDVPLHLDGKRIILAFDSVNLRAEVFVNRKLVGYDVVGNVPFDVDISDAVMPGKENRLDVRVTDPVGNFDWNDNEMYRWGDNMVPGVHGFGGITGYIHLIATDGIHIDDIYAQNLPNPREVNIFATIGNSTGREITGKTTIEIHEWKHPERVIWKTSFDTTVPSSGLELSRQAKVAKAKLWDLYQPNLYIARVTFTGSDVTMTDQLDKRFGFRYFEVGEKNGDKRFYLNGKRIFLFAAMTRGFWAENGIFQQRKWPGEMSMQCLNSDLT